MLKQFVEMNSALAGPAAAGGIAALGSTRCAWSGVHGRRGRGQAGRRRHQATRERLAEMVEVAEKSQARGVSAEFFQSFIFGAKGAEEQIASFENAHCEGIPGDQAGPQSGLDGLGPGLTKVSAVEKAIRETRELFTTDQNFSGATFFLGGQGSGHQDPRRAGHT
jgi:hypothetical protein